MSIPGADATLFLDEEKQKENLINMEKTKLNKDAKILEQIVYKNANPHPIVITISIVIIIFSIWLIYIIFMKPNASGQWMDQNHYIWEIDHDKFTNGAIITIHYKNRKKVIHCHILDNLIKCGNQTGIWDYKNMITFINGPKLLRIL